MKRPRCVRPLTDEERRQVAAGLRSSDAFVLRRCQILHASAAGAWAPAIAAVVGLDEQTVRNVVRAFNARGLACLVRGSSVAHRVHRAFDAAQAERLRDVLHQSPRRFGQPTSVWTLPLAAAVCVAEGITPARVTGETVRATLERLGVRWRRAKHWVTSPDPEYRRKKGGATG